MLILWNRALIRTFFNLRCLSCHCGGAWRPLLYLPEYRQGHPGSAKRYPGGGRNGTGSAAGSTFIPSISIGKTLENPGPSCGDRGLAPHTTREKLSQPRATRAKTAFCNPGPSVPTTASILYCFCHIFLPRSIILLHILINVHLTERGSIKPIAAA